MTESDQHTARHHKPSGLSDRLAYGLVKFMRFFADTFFANRYGHRAVVLETVAAIPGIVGGASLHLKSLRRIKSDDGWIQTLLDEAENERMHLMTFTELVQPNWFERCLVIVAQLVFYIAYSLIYLFSSKTAHRIVGYLEEEAVKSYTQYLDCIDRGETENLSVPDVAIRYWDLPKHATLKDVIKVIRADEMRHREVNHCAANKLDDKECDMHMPDAISSEVKEDMDDIISRSAP